MKLREVVIKNDVETYAAEFFDEVATKETGKLFAFERNVKETGIRSLARRYGILLNTKFTVITVTPAGADSNGTYAVGVTNKVRRTRAIQQASAAAKEDLTLADPPETSTGVLTEDWLLRTT